MTVPSVSGKLRKVKNRSSTAPISAAGRSGRSFIVFLRKDAGGHCATPASPGHPSVERVGSRFDLEHLAELIERVGCKQGRSGKDQRAETAQNLGNLVRSREGFDDDDVLKRPKERSQDNRANQCGKPAVTGLAALSGSWKRSRSNSRNCRRDGNAAWRDGRLAMRDNRIGFFFERV